MDNQDKNIEDIRALLRKKLAEPTPADNGWNLPSNQVWSGLSEELQATKAVVRPARQQYWLWAALSALLVLLLLRECSHRSQVGGLQSEVQNLQASFSQLKKECEEKQVGQNEIQSNDQKLEPINQASSENTFSNFGQREKTAQQGNPRRKGTPLSSKNNFENEQEKDAFSAPLPELQERFPTVDEKGIDKADSGLLKQMAQVAALPILPILAFHHSAKTPNTVDIGLPPQSAPTIPKTTLLASVYAGISLTGNKLTGEQPAIISGQKSLFAHRTGVGLEAMFSRHWSLEAGLHYATTNTQTVYRLEVPFTHTGEFQHDDGNFDNQYNHSLPSSLGDYPAQLVLTRENTANVAEGELMDLDLTIQQRLRFLSLPMHLRYGFGKNPASPMQAGIRGGLIANRALGISSEASSLVSHHSAIHQRHTSIGAPTLDDLQKTTIDFGIGLDARYFVTPQFSLSLETGYQRGMTPIYKDELVKNYLKAWNMGIAVRLVL